MTDDLQTLWVLVSHFFLVSMFTIGGGVLSVVPEIQRYVVEVQHWMTNEQYVVAVTLGQAAPGPNVFFVALVGLHVAGVLGAVLVSVAIIGPPAVIAWFVERSTHGGEVGPIGRALRTGLAPLATGMMMSTGILMVRTTVFDWISALVPALTAYVLLRYRVNPFWMITVGALMGLAGVF